jgi:aspartokinase
MYIMNEEKKRRNGTSNVVVVISVVVTATDNLGVYNTENERERERKKIEKRNDAETKASPNYNVHLMDLRRDAPKICILYKCVCVKYRYIRW